jgi:hypothetical protein
MSEWLRWLVPGRDVSAEELAGADWPRVLEESRRHHVAAALATRLRASGHDAAVPAAVRDALAEEYQRGRIGALVWQRALRLVLPALAAAGIRVVPFKGAALAFLVYGDPAARSMSDLDLWLDAADMDRACDLLQDLGFEAFEDPERPRAFQARSEGEIPLRGKRVGVPLVELHWGLFPGEWVGRTTAVDRAAVRARCRPGELFGHPVDLLAPEDDAIQLAVHVAITHVFSQTVVRCLLDLVVLDHAGVDWAQVAERARAWRLQRPVAHALFVAGTLFDRPALCDAARLCVPQATLARLLRHADAGAVLAGRRLDGGLGKWRYLLNAVQRGRDRWRLLALSLWPEDEWLGARYGRGGVRSRVRHLAGAVRGRF